MLNSSSVGRREERKQGRGHNSLCQCSLEIRHSAPVQKQELKWEYLFEQPEMVKSLQGL